MEDDASKGARGNGGFLNPFRPCSRVWRRALRGRVARRRLWAGGFAPVRFVRAASHCVCHQMEDDAGGGGPLHSCTAGSVRRDLVPRIVSRARLLCAGSPTLQSKPQYPPPNKGHRGVRLAKELMAVAGRTLRRNMTTLGPRVLPLSEKLLFAANLAARAALGPKRVAPYVPDFGRAFEHICIHTGGAARARLVGLDLHVGGIFCPLPVPARGAACHRTQPHSNTQTPTPQPPTPTPTPPLPQQPPTPQPPTPPKPLHPPPRRARRAGHHGEADAAQQGGNGAQPGGALQVGGKGRGWGPF